VNEWIRYHIPPGGAQNPDDLPGAEIPRNVVAYPFIT